MFTKTQQEYQPYLLTKTR